MNHTENEKHLSNLENQGIDGHQILGGGVGDINVTADYSNESGVISESAIMDNIPQNLDPIGANPIIVVDSPLHDDPTQLRPLGSIGPVPNNA